MPSHTPSPLHFRHSLARYPRAVPLLIFLLIALLTGLAVLAIERSDAQQEEDAKNAVADHIVSQLDHRNVTNTYILRAGAALISASGGEVDRDVFRRFVQELRLDDNYRGVEGIGWTPVITAAEVPAFERRIADLTGEATPVFPGLAQQPRSRLTPVLYLEPDTSRNQRALGFDMLSEPVRRAAMDLAAERGQPVASGRVVLRQDYPAKTPGFLIYMPVYRGSGAARRLTGYIYTAMNAPKLFAGSVNFEPDTGFGAQLYDGPEGTGKLLAAVNSGNRANSQISRTVSFAGRPLRLVVTSDDPVRLSPLSLTTLLSGLAIAVLLMVLARLLIRQAFEDKQRLAVLEEQSSIRNSLTRELNHRVKNTLANVLSIIALTRRRASDVNSFADGLDGRIRALSATHDLLTQSEWGTTPIAAVIDAELAPYAREGENMIEASGPDVELAPNDALSLGLAIHELATNAAKYGALSQGAGRVEVRWELTSDGLARIFWTETGGPPVPDAAERRRGFGTDLIEKIVSHELRHPVDLDFRPEGVRCTLLVPVRARGAFAIRARGAGAGGH